MAGLRDEIRAILREELAALTSSQASAQVPSVETVQITTGADLTRFAQSLLTRASDPGFAARVVQGTLRFELAGAAPIGAAVVTHPVRPSADVLAKPLITERDIAARTDARTLRIAASSRLTPLARDEAKRRGIRIERSET